MGVRITPGSISGGGGGGGASLIHQASRTLNNAALLGLANSFLQMAGAPGTNRWITNVTGHISADAVAGPYTFDGAASMDFGWGVNATVIINSANLTALFGGDGEAAHSILDPFVDNSGATYWDASQFKNLPLLFECFNNGNPIGGGNIANSTIATALFYVFDQATGLFLTTAESGWNQTTRTFS